MLARVILFFTLLPLVEIAVLVWIASRTSLVFVICLVLATGLLGAALARHQGWRTLRRISTDVDSGRMPADSLVDGLLVLVAAVLLILPGVLSDFAAIVLLFPPSRRALKAYARQRFQVQVDQMRHDNSFADVDPERIIDVRLVSENQPPHHD